MNDTAADSPSLLLHLGLGSFHRAHQAVYLQRLIGSGNTSWRLAGGNLRPEMADQLLALQAQGGAYTLETVTPAGERQLETIRSISSVLPYEPSLAGLVHLGAQAGTRIISFTVTEAGYGFNAQHRLDLNDPDVAADILALREGRPCKTIYGALGMILRERKRLGSGPVTLLNCDNLRHNGDRVRAGLSEFLAQVGDTELLDWSQTHTTCPNSMVDRITPRPTPEVAERIRKEAGWPDAAPLMAESFIQWVIEDRFAAGRPCWESVGVEMVESVDPYEEAKIRLLNATHSCIAWAGTLLGSEYIHEAVRHPGIRRLAFAYATEAVIPALQPSPLDLAAYRDVVLDRFGSPAIRDTLQRVAADSFAKLPGFILPTVRDSLANGKGLDSVMALPALMLRFLQRWDRQQLPFTYQDQAMDAAAAHALCQAEDPAAAFCANAVLWGELAGDARVLAALRPALQALDAGLLKTPA